jgi:hypothetical protein
MIGVNNLFIFSYKFNKSTIKFVWLIVNLFEGPHKSTNLMVDL